MIEAKKPTKYDLACSQSLNIKELETTKTIRIRWLKMRHLTAASWAKTRRLKLLMKNKQPTSLTWWRSGWEKLQLSFVDEEAQGCSEGTLQRKEMKTAAIDFELEDLTLKKTGSNEYRNAYLEEIQKNMPGSPNWKSSFNTDCSTQPIQPGWKKISK